MNAPDPPQSDARAAAGAPLSAHSIDVVLGNEATGGVIQSMDDVRAALTNERAAVVGSADPGERDLPPRRRRIVRPIVLFLATCASTWLSGAFFWMPEDIISVAVAFFDNDKRERVIQWLLAWDWVRMENGLLYMGLVMSILLAHEFGHFLMALWHRLPASLPYFIPFQPNHFGTMGAVIAMDGRNADRRQLFDVGIAGPIAGLFVAVPMTIYGVMTAPSFGPVGVGGWHFHDPLLVQLLIAWLRPDVPTGQELNLTPYLAASFIGLLVTGLNMMPVSQLDGGHVTYGLFGRAAHWIARVFVLVAIGYVVFYEAYIWSLMLLLVVLIGVRHPPTANDHVPLGPWRWALGVLSLLIPVFCFSPQGITIAGQ